MSVPTSVIFPDLSIVKDDLPQTILISSPTVMVWVLPTSTLSLLPTARRRVHPDDLAEAVDDLLRKVSFPTS